VHEPAPDDPPVVPGTIHGIRCWRLHDDRLGGLFHSADWLEGGRPTRARCDVRSSHDAPQPDCSCGLYAYHPWSRAAAAAAGQTDTRRGQADVVAGIVEAWGQIDVHADGFRAELARPVAFFMPRPSTGSRRLRACIESLAERHHAELIEADGHRPDWAPGLDESFVSELVPPPRAPAEWRTVTAYGPSRTRKTLLRVGDWVAFAAWTVMAIAMWAPIVWFGTAVTLEILGL
jgi:hypothetical protein